MLLKPRPANLAFFPTRTDTSYGHFLSVSGWWCALAWTGLKKINVRMKFVLNGRAQARFGVEDRSSIPLEWFFSVKKTPRWGKAAGRWRAPAKDSDSHTNFLWYRPWAILSQMIGLHSEFDLEKANRKTESDSSVEGAKWRLLKLDRRYLYRIVNNRLRSVCDRDWVMDR